MLVLSCNLPKYNKERFDQWGHTLQHFADDYPIYYLFGKSDATPPIPAHPNVHLLQVDTGDLYEDIPQKIYRGFKYLSFLNYDYIVKIDETIRIKDIPAFKAITQDDVTKHAYISLNGATAGDSKHMYFSTYHFGKVANKALNSTPALCLTIPYAGGPCYAIRKDALQKIDKQIFYSTLYEDYALGLCMHVNNIKLHVSSTVSRKLLHDNLNTPAIDYVFPQATANMNLIKYTWSFAPAEKECTVSVNGGIGNQLFQIATGINYAYKHGMRLRLLCSTYNVRPYYWDTLLKHYSNLVTTKKPSASFNEATFSYTEIPYTDSDIYINGYFQSSKYFPLFKKHIREIVSLPDVSSLLTRCSIDDSTVFVHMRRGDYLKSLEFHGVLGNNYYISAINCMRDRVPNAKFIVSSDDPVYCKKSPVFDGLNVEYINENDISTFSLMTHCKHFIIANSTFSWWGAMIAGAKNVIAPRNWFGPKGPSDTNDIYEPDWTLF